MDVELTERLLQFIWQFQYFNKNELCTSAGEKLTILAQGQLNRNQGPDFTDAKIIVDGTTWAGTIELHIKTTDWIRHRHQDDKNYRTVILHVVWEDDLSSVANGNTNLKAMEAVPLMELSPRVPKVLLQRYEELMQSRNFIPCDKNLQLVQDITWQSWKDRLLAERLMRKSLVVEECLRQNNYHWEETFWWLLAKNFGTKVNGDAFEAIARSLPLTLLAKHKHQVHQLEALLLGQGGMLNSEFEEHYPKLLQREYLFLQAKYQLHPVPVTLHLLRMRPGNFPAVRLAELAMLVNGSAHLFSKIREAATTSLIRQYFNVTANDYWHYHYQLDELSVFKPKKIGESMIDNILINTVAPVLFAYGSYLNDTTYKDKALLCLEQVRAEQNQVTTQFMSLAVQNHTARDSQALIELKHNYCDKRKCLECAIGNAILKRAEAC